MTGNVFYKETSAIFLFFYDIDDEEERLALLLNAHERLCPQYPLNLLVSKHHVIGHGIIDCGRDYSTWINLSVITNHKAFWAGQAIKFLRLTGGLTQYIHERSYVPAITKTIDAEEKYRPSDYLIIKAPNTFILKQLLNALGLCELKGQAQKLTRIMFLMMLTSVVPQKAVNPLTRQWHTNDDSWYYNELEED